MGDTTATAASDRGSTRESLAIALAIAMCMALAYTLGVAWKLFVTRTMVAASRDLLWMAPLSAVAFSLLFQLPWIAIASRLSSERARWITVFAGSWLLVFSALLPWTQIHRLAALVLAAGVATAAARAVGTTSRIRLLRRSGLVIAAGFLLGAALVFAVSIRRFRSAVASLPTPAADAPNVLFILLDTVRASALSLYGYERATSPHIDSLAAGGVIFEQAVATAPWTLPSHASLFTGEYPGLLSTSFKSPLDESRATLAEHFRDAGYETIGFTGNLHYTAWDSGLSRGFLEWADFKRSLTQTMRSSWIGQSTFVLALMHARAKWQVGEALRHPQFRVVPKPGGEERDASELADAILRWDASRPPRPFFAFVNFFDAHEDYTPPAAYRTRFAAKPKLRDLYDGEIAYIDNEIGRMMAELQRRGTLRNTIVVLVADHGEQFKEHKISGHGNSLYYQLLHVPLVVRFDGRVPAGRRIPGIVSLRDVGATILALARVKSAASFPGKSLATTWATSDSTGLSRSPAISELTQDAVPRTDDPLTRSQGISLVEESGMHAIHRNVKGKKDELFNVRKDAAELVDLAADSGGKAVAAQIDRLRALIKQDKE